MKKTREQRKRILRDVVDGILIMLAALAVMAVLCGFVGGMVCDALAHPAEQPITYAEHIARFQEGVE